MTHRGRRWSTLRGHETCQGCAEMDGGTACGRTHWGRRWRSLAGHGAREGCTEMEGGPHVDAPIGAVGGSPHRATGQVRGVPEWTATH